MRKKKSNETADYLEAIDFIKNLLNGKLSGIPNQKVFDILKNAEKKLQDEFFELMKQHVGKTSKN